MENSLLLLNEENLKDYIYFIRGQRVMIDSDLAKIYGYTTKILIDKLKIILKDLMMILDFN